MSEIGGATELQLLQHDIALTKKQLEGIQGAENTSVACARIATHIQKAEDVDGFLVTEGGAQPILHTSGPAAKEGCWLLL